MAVEVREIIIKTTISDDKKNDAGSHNSSGDKEEIIQECIDKILEIMNQEKER